MGKKIYIVLTDTGTLLSKAIGLYTRKDLNHASIAFDEELNEMYSFGRKQRHNPFVGGFVKENAAEGIFQEADCIIFSCQVSDEQYHRMRIKFAKSNVVKSSIAIISLAYLVLPSISEFNVIVRSFVRNSWQLL